MEAMSFAATLPQLPLPTTVTLDLVRAITSALSTTEANDSVSPSVSSCCGASREGATYMLYGWGGAGGDYDGYDYNKERGGGEILRKWSGGGEEGGRINWKVGD